MKKLTLSLLCAGMLAVSVGTSSAMTATARAVGKGIRFLCWYSDDIPATMCVSFIGGAMLGICHSKKATRIGMYASGGVGALSIGSALPFYVFRDLSDVARCSCDMLSTGLVVGGLNLASFKAGCWSSEKACALLNTVAKKAHNAPVPAVVTPASTATAAKVAVCSKSKMGEKLFARVKKMATFFGF